MRKKMLSVSLLFNIALVAAFLLLINQLGGWKHFVYKINNRGLAGTYQHRAELLEKLPMQQEDIIFLGNSLTAYCEWGEMLQNSNIKNRGIPGDGVAGVLKRLPNIISDSPKAIFLMIGINDLFYHDKNYVLKHFEEILKEISSVTPATKVIIQSLLPVNGSIKNIPLNNSDINQINSALYELALKYHYSYLDLHSHFINDLGKLNEKFSVDGIHINGEGYMLWRDLLLTKHSDIFVKE